MFTGIITAIGTVRSVSPVADGKDMRLVIDTPWPTRDVDIGASIACSGCCLTVIERDANWFAVQVSAETIAKTTLGRWQPGTRVNLERALRLGDELGGHIVSGHVDGTGKLLLRHNENGSLRLRFEAPRDLARFIAPKGSITINGVSLTVNEVSGCEFGINLIPHTAENTNLGDLVPGDIVHLEIDMLARYVARLAEFQ